MKVRFKCRKCGIEEAVPKDIVDMLEESDQGDITYPPRLRCEKCPGIMEPIDYTSSRGIHYKYES